MAKIKDEKTDAQIHHGRREKLRQSFLNFGLESFNETQVIEYALGVTMPRIDTNPTAHRLINKFGSLKGVVDAHPHKLQEVAGIGEQSAIFLNFLKQFVTYYQNSAKDKKMKLRSPDDAIIYLRDVMRTYSAEVFVVICVDKSGTIILEHTTSSGDLDKVEINLREIVDIVLRVKAASIIIAHNHLTDNVSPSDSDIMLTRYIINMFSPMSIEVMDHIIFGPDGADFSFSRYKFLEVFKREHQNFAISRDYEDYILEIAE